jgi:ATP-dependent RNA helicase RhlE
MLDTTLTAAPEITVAPPAATPTGFAALGLIEPILRAVAAENYTTPTPIQQHSIPHLLTGRDLLGCAQTGTGKTAAFALPILHRLAGQRRPAAPRSMRVLILTPTRELAAQIGDSFRAYGRHLGLHHAVIFGGVGQRNQVQALSRGLDVLIATPGRLLDLMNQGFARLSGVEIFVLDEADRMLDMGFIHDVKRVIAGLPKQRQTLLFSATMPPDIARLADGILADPARVAVTPVASTAERIEQWLLYVERGNKAALLTSVLKDPGIARALVFTRTKHGANKVVMQLGKAGIRADAIHGNKSQSARQRALESFRAGHVRVLVATDIAARGIDIDGITHVINFDLPDVPESYVHRIGRTARAGADGTALSFCDNSERGMLREIEKLTRQQLAVIADHPYNKPLTGPVDATPVRNGRFQQQRNRGGGQRHGGGHGQGQGPGRSSGHGQSHGASQRQGNQRQGNPGQHRQGQPQRRHSA